MGLEVDMLIGIDCSRAFVSERTGTENYSYYLLRELLREGGKHTFRLYLRKTDQAKGDSDWLRRIRDELPEVKNYELVLIKQKKLWTQIGLAWELWRNKVDVLFVPAHTLPLIRPRQIKTVVTVHDLGYEYLPQYHQFPHKLWLTYFTEYAVNSADRLIAVSEATKEDLISKLDADKNKISVIYEGFAHSKLQRQHWSQIKKRYGLPKQYLLFVGTVQPRKNLVRMIEALALLRKDARYEDVELVVIGKKGWLSEEIYAAPAKQKVAVSVRFLDYVQDGDVQLIWAYAQVFLYTTLFEGFGIPILESQALGVPVVTSNKKPFTEVGGEACVYVDETDAKAIARGVESLLGDDELVRRIVTKGYKNTERFAWDKAAIQTLNLIEELG